MPGAGPLQANKRGSAVPSQDGSSSKRSRVSRACDQCRTAREKCDGKPTCSTCSTSNRPCTYTTNPKKRGIQPGYIRTLELALTWLFNNSDAESLLTQKLTREGLQSALLGKETNNKESNKLHRAWRKSKFCKDVDRLLSGSEVDPHQEMQESEDEQSEEEVEDVPLPSNLTPILPDARSVVERPIQSSRSYQSPPIQLATIGLTPLPTARWQLFDVYFAYTHSWFPLCEKHDVLKLTYSYPDEGLPLSSTMPGSGDHAELWGILALASVQENAFAKESNTNLVHDSTPYQLYSITRSLIPLELGSFQLGHVKALLLLALINVSQSEIEAAWLLVGYASRILLCLEQSELVSRPNLRYKHSFFGCFLLDTLLSMQSGRRPYLQVDDVERIGKLDTDGLEEWQPWTGCQNTQSSLPPSRSPVLSLSSFNNIVELAGILSTSVSPTHSTHSNHTLQEALGRLEMWKVSLPPTFDYIRSERVTVPYTPPAIVLQILFSMCTLRLSSQSPAQQIVRLLESIRKCMGLASLPPILPSLLHLLVRDRYFDLDHGLRARLQKFQADLSRSWPSFGSTNVQIPTPESIQIPFNTSYIPLGTAERPRTSSTLLDDILPDMNTSSNPQSLVFQNSMPEFHTSNFDGFNPPLMQHRNSTASRDIENFFDELASLDGAERLENQPQFMQNLGFAPDANIADLLSSDFGIVNSLPQTYLQHGADHAQLDQAHFFNGG
ncbi:hypothetical protein B0J11DRAFT_422603 [Dendryphion nanum]|uniref:Zn(2)-C6 fungal-type domain-containing protein n=1 Tax=Dendryphion nanum TaxID=256645 RepID=A0A9P9EL98_9PLEO|nr:hypothetical protein B0J11DRAFT_422603 [Dendryphion nanum]